MRTRASAVLWALIAAFSLWCGASTAQAAGPFSNWAVIVVAGDWHAHSGAPSEVFDNARRDLAHAFIKAGFNPNNVKQFSVRPERYSSEGPLKSDIDTIAGQFTQLAAKANGGCLVYFTSHGAPTGILVDGQIWGGEVMSQIVDDACGKRPTVVVLSACFSGGLIPAVNGPNRMVLTAARPDRTSFGCGEEDRYTFFDNCVLQQLPLVDNFLGLGRAVTACVALREEAMRLEPPSEPQTNVGGLLRPMLPLLAFTKPPPTTPR
jgi:hypothetical protein